jgi:hypothetical protein
LSIVDPGIRLLMTAACADEYFFLQIKGAIGWLSTCPSIFRANGVSEDLD